VAQLPPEIYNVKGQELIDKLKARRTQIPAFAKEYYFFVAREVEITGTRQREYFEVTDAGVDEMAVAVYRINNRGIKNDTPYYRRVFTASETKEIRLFGIKGEDVYVVNSNKNPITVRIIGGPGKDSVIQTKHPVHIYDDADNVFQTSSARMHVSSDSSIHGWDYKWFRYDRNGLRPVVFYNNADRIFAGLHYHYTKYKWRQEPYAWRQEVGINYSISQNALSAFWQAMYPNVIGKWNLVLRADYDVIRWTNFYGTGNESKYETNDLDYYRLRSEEWYASAGLNRSFGRNNVQVTGYYQRVKNKDDPDRYLTKVFADDRNVYLPNTYAGLQLTYSYIKLRDSVTPENGFTILANAVYANNFQQNEFYQRYNAQLQAYFPLVEHVSLAVRLGGETIVNDDVLNSGQAYEHAIIGGPRTLRGYRRDRFWGKTAFYNSNELRYITSFRSWLMNGKIGLFGFFDQGRVWMPGERSDKIHFSWGPGIILVPFNKYNISASYGISEEIRLIQFRLNKTF
jgi:hypothetical protein